MTVASGLMLAGELLLSVAAVASGMQAIHFAGTPQWRWSLVFGALALIAFGADFLTIGWHMSFAE